MVGLLSLNSATRFSLSVVQTWSTINHRRRSPTILRSKFVNFPPLFVSKITNAVMLGGHCCQNTVGRHADSSPIMIPPAPWLEASTTPIKSGHPATSSLHQVGRDVDSCSIVHMSLIADSRGTFWWKYTTSSHLQRSRLHGESRPFPPCSARNAWQSFAVIDSNFLKATPR